MREQKQLVMTCKYEPCGVEFVATRADAKFCGSKCRIAAYRAKHAPSLLEAMAKKRCHMIGRWNVVRSASDYAEKLINEIFSRYGLDAAILAISAAYGVQMNIDTVTEADYQAAETAEAKRLVADEPDEPASAWWLDE